MERGDSILEKCPWAVDPLKHPDHPDKEASQVNTEVGTPLLIGAAAVGRVVNHHDRSMTTKLLIVIFDSKLPLLSFSPATFCRSIEW